MNSGQRPTGADLYCGVGGMSLGFEQAGFNVIAAADIEKINVETHSSNFPECKTWCTDLSSVSGTQFRKETGIGDKHIDALFSGPPCQGFSLIGKRSQKDPRNLLVYEFARLIGELLPSYFVMENVEGILLGKARNTLDEFVRLVRAAGYSVVEPIQVLDAAEFGVPQKRRRVFVLGYQRGNVAPKYPKPSHPYSKNGEVHRPTVWDAIADLPKIANYEYLLTNDEYEGDLGGPSAYATILRGEARDPQDKSSHRTGNGDGLGGCLRTLHTAKTIKRFRNTKPGSYEEISRFYRLTKSGLAVTLRAGTGPAQGSFMAPRPIHPFQDRCITVREAARLHSFPDWFHFHPTKWHGFRQIGNSVPPLLARAVAKAIGLALKASREKG
jgi:DNA (cytosine-5)-methyltransferase 1